MKSSLAIILLITPVLTSADTLCTCTTQACPVEGENLQIVGAANNTATYTYKLNENDIPVVKSATVKITKDDLGMGSGTTSCTTSYARAMEDDGLDNVDAGHILAHNLGGPGNAPNNIFPQALHYNRGQYAQYEENIFACLDPDSTSNPAESVLLSWAFSYNDTKSTQPHSVTYTSEYQGGECKDLVTEFPNTYYA